MVTYGLMETWINDLDRMIRITDKKEKIDMKKKVMTAVLMMSMVMGSSLTVCAAPETMADGTVFDAEYYAQMYPDVVAALGTDADAMYQHYVTFGRAEGRQAVSPDTAVSQPGNDGFDVVFYARMYPDVVAALGTDADALYQHYVTFGKAEGRLGSANGSVEIVPKTNNTVSSDIVYPDYSFVQKLGAVEDIVIAPENKFIVSIEDTKGHTEKFYDGDLLGDEQTAFMYFNECAFDDNKLEIFCYTETGEICGAWSREMNESGKYNLGPMNSAGIGPLTRMLVVRGKVKGELVGYYSNWFTVTVDTGLVFWLTSDEMHQSFGW